MFTIEQRAALRERVLRLAEEDDPVVAGAAGGSLAMGDGSAPENFLPRLDPGRLRAFVD